jgi:hypothetical protein
MKQSKVFPASNLSLPSSASGFTSFLEILVRRASGGMPFFLTPFNGATPLRNGAGSLGNFSRGVCRILFIGFFSTFSLSGETMRSWLFSIARLVLLLGP